MGGLVTISFLNLYVP